VSGRRRKGLLVGFFGCGVLLLVEGFADPRGGSFQHGARLRVNGDRRAKLILNKSNHIISNKLQPSFNYQRILLVKPK
jgi:hypothetical protein